MLELAGRYRMAVLEDDHGAELYYECLDCEKVVSSIPHIKVACACGNLEGGGGKMGVKNPERVRVVRGKLK